MPKSPNQKLKLLYLMKILLEETDETHPVTVADMIAGLAKYDISAERKSIYDDIESLRQYGLDIIQVKSRRTRYYIGERKFELPELKLLVDSIQSSKFITQKKTLALIEKIESLTSRHNAQKLQRYVYVRGRVKSMNESVYYNVDEISAGIAADKVIRFKYFEYTPAKERRFRRNGAFYEISPFAMLCDDENYYMVGYDGASKILKHYRMDKMTEISVTEIPRLGKEVFKRFEMSEYSKKFFGMFTGEEKTVQMRFAEHLAGAVIDRFGKEIVMIPYGDGSFVVTAEVAVSPLFFAWIFAFGDEAEIIAPDTVRQEMRKQAERTAKLYM